MSTGELVLSARRDALSVRVDSRSAATTVALALALALAVVALAALSTALGTRLLPLSDVLAGLAGTGERALVLTVRDFRLPRTPSRGWSGWLWAPRGR